MLCGDIVRCVDAQFIGTAVRQLRMTDIHIQYIVMSRLFETLKTFRFIEIKENTGVKIIGKIELLPQK